MLYKQGEGEGQGEETAETTHTPDTVRHTSSEMTPFFSASLRR